VELFVQREKPVVRPPKDWTPWGPADYGALARGVGKGLEIGSHVSFYDEEGMNQLDAGEKPLPVYRIYRFIMNHVGDEDYSTVKSNCKEQAELIKPTDSREQEVDDDNDESEQTRQEVDEDDDGTPIAAPADWND